MLKNVSNFYHKIITLPDQVLIFLTLVDKVVVDIILRSTEEAVRGAYYGPGLQLPTEREA